MHDNYFELVKNVDVDTYIKLLEKVGWFSHMSGGKREEKKKRIRDNYGDNGKYAFDSLFDIGFDAESIGVPEGKNQTGYPELIKEFSDASSGAFNPSNIKEINQPEKVIISFDHDEKNYSQTMEEKEQYEEKFAEIINSALEESGIKRRFIKLPTTDQSTAFYFISKEVHKKALEEKLIPSQFDVDKHL